MREESASGATTTLRGHHLLCILGFRGYGYSPEFVAGMRAVVESLKEAPETMVELVDSRDRICLPCPHLVNGACRQHGEESEAETATRDRRVLTRLALRLGQRIAWAEVLDIMRTTLKLTDVPGLCEECQWASLGFCDEGLSALLNRADRCGD